MTARRRLAPVIVMYSLGFLLLPAAYAAAFPGSAALFAEKFYFSGSYKIISAALPPFNTGGGAAGN